MKAEMIYNAVTELRDDQIAAGEQKLPRAVRPARFRRLGAIAAILAVVVLVGALAWPRLFGGAPNSPRSADPATYSLARASYPRMAPHPDTLGLYLDSREYNEARAAWRNDINALRSNTNYSAGLSEYLRTALPCFLSGAGTENRVVSPLNIYAALAMVAETADGQTRDELLHLLNAPDMETLRERTKTLWKANYLDDGINTELLAASIWLQNGWSYNQETLKRLAENYFGSVFSGQMGSEDYNEAMRTWINEQTKNLRANQTGGVGASAEAVMALITTTCFQAEWMCEFEKTETGTFHGARGDVSCEFMQGLEYGVKVRAGDGFLAGEKWMKNNIGSVYFVLPEEGISPEELMTREDFLNFLSDPDDKEKAEYKEAWLYLTAPKFDISSQLSLQEKLEELGVREVFDADKANFSQLSPESEGLFLSEVQHGARLSIDEKGITGAAFSYSEWASPYAEEIHMTLDRPFIFVVKNAENLPIFVGIVNNP